MLVHIEQASHDFVHRVEGRPDFLTSGEAIKVFGGESAEVTAFELLLALSEFGNKIVTAGFQLVVGAGGITQGAGRKIVADKMAAEFTIGFLPTSQRRRRRGEAGVYAKDMQEAIGRLFRHELVVGFLRLLKDAGEQSNARHWKWFDFECYVVPGETDLRVKWEVCREGAVGDAWGDGIIRDRGRSDF